MEIALGFGKEKIPVQVPDNQVMAVLTPNEAEIGLTGSDEVYRSMREPIGLPPLREVVKAGETVAIITSDITRPIPSYKVLPAVLDELSAAGIKDSDITIEYEGTIDFMGSDVEFTLNADCDFKGVTKTGTGYVSGKLGTKLPIVGELSIPVEGYQQYQDDGMLTYTRFNKSEWLRSKVVPLQTSAEGIQFDLDYKVVLGILQKIAAGEIKTELAQETETLHGQEVYRMDIAIAGDLLNQILLTVSKAQGENSAVPDNFDISDGDAAIVLYIYKESKLPAKLVIDCTALGRAVIRNLLKNSNTGDSISTGTSRFVITADITEYNTIDEITIPDEVVSSAVEPEQFNLLSIFMGN